MPNAGAAPKVPWVDGLLGPGLPKPPLLLLKPLASTEDVLPLEEKPVEDDVTAAVAEVPKTLPLPNPVGLAVPPNSDDVDAP